VTIVADTGAPVTVSGTVTVESLLANQTVVLSGLVVTGVTAHTMGNAPGTGLVASGNAGPLRLVDCRFEGARGYGDGGTSCDLPDHDEGWQGALVAGNSAGTAFVRCTVLGGRAANAYYGCIEGTGGPGGDGVQVSGSRVALYDCDSTGGRGGASGYSGGPGGAGVRLVASSIAGLFASNTRFQGGVGGDGYDYIASVGGAGGDGAALDVGTLAWFLDSAEAGGVGGQACGGLFPPGPDGVPRSGEGSTFDFAVPKLVLDAARVAREQSVVPMTIRGRPGDELSLVFGSFTPFRAASSLKGVLLGRSPAPQFVAMLGPIPASGELQTSLVVPELGPGIASKTWFLQIWSWNPVDGVTLGSFSPLTLLDSSY
jgi:hypothetical protein